MRLTRRTFLGYFSALAGTLGLGAKVVEATDLDAEILALRKAVASACHKPVRLAGFDAGAWRGEPREFVKFYEDRGLIRHEVHAVSDIAMAEGWTPPDGTVHTAVQPDPERAMGWVHVWRRS